MFAVILVDLLGIVLVESPVWLDIVPSSLRSARHVKAIVCAA
jgi:hypothetical protein